jgi:hypothetical protein
MRIVDNNRNNRAEADNDHIMRIQISKNDNPILRMWMNNCIRIRIHILIFTLTPRYSFFFFFLINLIVLCYVGQ